MSNAPRTDRTNAPEAASTVDGHSSRRRLLWTVGLAGVAAGAGWSWWQPSARPVAPAPAAAAGGAGQPLGEDFWSITLPQPDETPLTLASLRGKPLLLNFWATWCPPCVREMPMLDEFYRRYAPRGLQMVGVAVDSPTPVRGFLAKSPVSFPIALAGAEGTGLSRALGNTLGGLPFTVLVDAQGLMVQRQMGELKAEQLLGWAGALGWT